MVKAGGADVQQTPLKELMGIHREALGAAHLRWMVRRPIARKSSLRSGV
jgi:hypothetical protein